MLQIFGQTTSNGVFDRLFPVYYDVHRHLKVKLWSGSLICFLFKISREKRTDTFFHELPATPHFKLVETSEIEFPLGTKKSATE